MSPIILTQPFRPFFPLAALHATLAISLWLAGLSGLLPLPPHATLWHAHEMLFGFAAGVIIGFSLTAVGNWTSLAATTPRTLTLLAALWLTARVSGWWPSSTAQLISACFDALVLPLAASLMTHVLLRSGNRRNYMFIPFLWGLAAINLGFHWSLQHDDESSARSLITLTTWLVGVLMVFMGGRVIPFFSAKKCPYTPTQWPWLNWLSTLSALLAAGLLSLLPLSTWAGSVAGLAGISALVRWLLWRPWRVAGEPMLWILHLGYAWLALAYLLAAMVHLGILGPALTLPLHALMAGGLGCLGLGMITRVALGHSGRPITANSRMRVAFTLVVLAGVMRVASYGAWPLGRFSGLTLSALLWSAAFLIYFLMFSPLLWRR